MPLRSHTEQHNEGCSPKSNFISAKPPIHPINTKSFKGSIFNVNMLKFTNNGKMVLDSKNKGTLKQTATLMYSNDRSYVQSGMTSDTRQTLNFNHTLKENLSGSIKNITNFHNKPRHRSKMVLAFGADKYLDPKVGNIISESDVSEESTKLKTSTNKHQTLLEDKKIIPCSEGVRQMRSRFSESKLTSEKDFRISQINNEAQRKKEKYNAVINGDRPGHLKFAVRNIQISISNFNTIM